MLIYYEYTLPENVVERARLALLASSILVGTRVQRCEHACVCARRWTRRMFVFTLPSHKWPFAFWYGKNMPCPCATLFVYKFDTDMCVQHASLFFVQLVSVLKADIDSDRARINEIVKLADMLRASMANGVCARTRGCSQVLTGCQPGLTRVSGNTYALPCITDTCCRCLKPIVDDDHSDLPVHRCKQCAAPVHSEHEHQLCAVCFQPLLAADLT